MSDTILRTVGQLREALKHSDDDEPLDILLTQDGQQVRCLAAGVGSTAGGRATLLFLDKEAVTPIVVDYGPVPAICHDHTLECLDRAFAADPNAMYALINNRIPCNDELADDPHIFVDPARVLPGSLCSVGMMGVLNGVLAANKLPLVGWQFAVNGERRTLVGFTRWTPEPAGDHAVISDVTPIEAEQD